MSLQHWSASIHRDLLQPYLLPTPMTQGDLAPRRPHVAHPVRSFSEHGQEVTLAPDAGHDERQADDTPRPSARHLQGYQVPRTDPARGERRGAPVEEASHQVGTSTIIEPSLQTHLRPPESSVFSRSPVTLPAAARANSERGRSLLHPVRHRHPPRDAWPGRAPATPESRGSRARSVAAPAPGSRAG